jgi:predicted metalloprotease with PDZ domain
VIESVAETDLSDFWQRYIEGTEELPFNDYLQPFALELSAEVDPDSPPYLGLTVKSEPQGAAMIKTVDAGSPAQQAGINVGDELLAIANFRVGAEQLSNRLKDYQPGDIIPITVFHQDQLSTHPVKLTPAIPSQYQIRRCSQATPAELENLKGWLGDLPEV